MSTKFRHLITAPTAFRSSLIGVRPDSSASLCLHHRVYSPARTIEPIKPSSCNRRAFSSSTTLLYADASSGEAAKDLNQKGQDEQQADFDSQVADQKQKQARTPWHREGSAVAPVSRPRSAGAMAKGTTIFSDRVNKPARLI